MSVRRRWLRSARPEQAPADPAPDQAGLPAVAALSMPQPGSDVAVRPVVAGVVMDRPDLLPSLPAGQVADLRAALAPHLDPRVVDLVAAVAVGATVLARQRQQQSGAAWLEHARRRAWADGIPVAWSGRSWRDRVPSRGFSTEPPEFRRPDGPGAA